MSLVETVVAIGIVVVLAALLVPAISSVRRKANAARCASNLHQIGIALRSYQADYHCWPRAAYMPPPFVDADGVRKEGAAVSINLALGGYILGSSRVYKCAADDAIYAQTAAALPDGWGTSYEYHVNTRSDSLQWPPSWEHGNDEVSSDYQFGPIVAGRHSPQLFHRTGWNSLASDGSVRFVTAAGPPWP
jgi:type II secretory pathway pseudopilin PulG